MNKYVVKASLMLLGEIVLLAFALFVVYVLLMVAPVEFIVFIFFFLAAVFVVTFIATLAGAAKDWIIYKARELAKKDGFKEGIHV